MQKKCIYILKCILNIFIYIVYCFIFWLNEPWISLRDIFQKQLTTTKNHNSYPKLLICSVYNVLFLYVWNNIYQKPTQIYLIWHPKSLHLDREWEGNFTDVVSKVLPHTILAIHPYLSHLVLTPSWIFVSNLQFHPIFCIFSG